MQQRILPGALALSLALAACGHTQSPAPGAAPSRAVASAETADSALAQRTEELLAQLSLEEKIAYLGGDRDFFIRPIARLGLPEIKFSDGPVGCRNWGPSTAYPAAVGLAAAFDCSLAERVGAAMGRDCRARGVHVLLGPGVNIQRSPLNGRNFEYLGEDPYLAGQTAAALIRGVQREGVLATVKHFAANNQEWDRGRISSEVDERTLREIYFPAFESAVRSSRVGSVMTAYNLLNGTYCSHDAWLLKRVLRDDWGFSGFVMSDWGAVHDTAGAAASGLDLEMPRGEFLNAKTLLPLLEQKQLEAAEIDDKLRNILRTLIGAGFLDRPQQKADIPLDDPSSGKVALEAARQSLVLLKNEGGLLPLDRARIRTLAVVGPNAQPLVHGGAGSAFVTPLHSTSLVDAIKQLAPGVDVVHHPGMREITNARLLGQPVFVGGVKRELFLGMELAGAPVSTSTVDRIAFNPQGPPAAGVPAQKYSIRWTGAIRAPRPGKYTVIANADDGVRVSVAGKRVIEDWTDHAPTSHEVTLELAAGRHDVVVEYYQNGGGAVAEFGFAAARGAVEFEGEAELTRIAKSADAVLVCAGYGQNADTNSLGRGFEPFWPPQWARNAGLVEAEDSDRPFEWPRGQTETIRVASAVNARVIVVGNAGGGVAFDGWLEKTPSLLWAWYPGQEGARAVAEVLFGEHNPSGKLPVTFARAYADHPSAPFYNISTDKKTPYGEGVFVGYRGFDARHVEPQFPFGHGLSYTKFAYTGLRAAPATDGSVSVEFRVKNEGPRAGSEIAQVYVAPPLSDVPRPPQELKGYARVELAAGESRVVELRLGPRAFAHWAKGWTVTGGSYEIRVGASSRDLRLSERIELATASVPISQAP